ncbi:MAG TPA: ThuA domain-containing protein [Tepidisphaeraceae bacterium]|jgi:trehalose utilization protein
MSIRVTVWNEFRHEVKNAQVKAVYPDGIHQAIARHLKEQGFDVRTATLDEPEHGLTDEVLNQTDVILWWGHGAHHEVKDEIVQKVFNRVQAGMGLLTLHSAHMSKIFRKLLGCTGNLKWRVAGEREVLWVTAPGHPILAGIDDHFIIAQEEMYGECFDVPKPDELLLISTFTGGECFRSAMTWQRGHGKIFYFRPGHETYPTYHDPNVLRVITNGVKWAAPIEGGKIPDGCPNPPKGWLDAKTA